MLLLVACAPEPGDSKAPAETDDTRETGVPVDTVDTVDSTDSVDTVDTVDTEAPDPSCLALAGPVATYTGAVPAAFPDADLSATLTPLDADTFYTTGMGLMPAWGFYPNAVGYGGTQLLDTHAAFGGGRLTWVFALGGEDDWRVFVRQYGGYGVADITIDDVVVGSGSGGGATYAWNEAGTWHGTPGPHYLDLTLDVGMIDAVLLTRDAAFDPDTADFTSLAATTPEVRSQRVYRAQALGDFAWAIGSSALWDEDVDDWTVDPTGEATVRAWGAADQVVMAGFQVVAGGAGADLDLRAGTLTGPDGATTDAIDLRVATAFHVNSALWEQPTGHARRVARALLHDEEHGTVPITGAEGSFGGAEAHTRMGPWNNRLLQLAVRLPADAAPGTWTGTIELQDRRDTCLVATIPVEIEVLDVGLEPVEGGEGTFYVATVGEGGGTEVSRDQFEAELADLADHGLNGLTAYAGLAEADAYVAAGLGHEVVDMILPENGTEGTAAEAVATAEAAGIDELVFWSVDEPQTEGQFEIVEGYVEDRGEGIHTMSSLNSQAAVDALATVVDRPVIIAVTFGESTTSIVRDAGGVPFAYWIESSTYPLYQRAVAGLWLRAIGYEGAFPWSWRGINEYDNPWWEFLDGPSPDSGCCTSSQTWPDESGMPIPSRTWEARRAAIDDVRYAQALRRAMVEACAAVGDTEACACLDVDPCGCGGMPDDGSARATALADAFSVYVADACYDSARMGSVSTWGQSVTEDWLDTARRELADATVTLRGVGY